MAAAGGMSTLAGCPSGNGDQSDGTPPETSDRTFETTEFTTVEDNNFNPMEFTYFPPRAGFYAFGTLIGTSQVTDEILPGLATGYERDGATVTVNLDDRFTWHDGDPVTSEDVLAQYTLDLLVQRPNWDRLLADVSAPDDYTVELELQTADAHEGVLIQTLAETYVATKPEIYQEYLPDDGSRGAGAYDDLSDFELTRLRREGQGFKVAAPYGVDPEEYQREADAHVVGWGPFKLAERGTRRMRFTKYEDHPFADRFNFTEVRNTTYTTNESRYQALLSDRLSGFNVGVTQTVWDQVPDYYTAYTRLARSGLSWAFNYDAFPDRRVRQALSYAMDRERQVNNSGLATEFNAVLEHDTGYVSSAEENAEMFGQEFVDNLPTYDLNTDRAASLLEEVGWSRDDGQWYDENDEPVQVTLKLPPTWTDWINMGQTAVDDLSSFGIDAELRTEELQIYVVDSLFGGSFEMAGWWSGGTWGYPYHSWVTAWEGTQNIPQITHNHPAEYEIPMPVGDPDGDLETVNVDDMLSDLAQTPSGSDRITELRRRIAWTYNQALPTYCLNNEIGLSLLNSNNWDAPDTDEPVANTQQPIPDMLHRGRIRAR